MSVIWNGCLPAALKQLSMNKTVLSWSGLRNAPPLSPQRPVLQLGVDSSAACDDVQPSLSTLFLSFSTGFANLDEYLAFTRYRVCGDTRSCIRAITCRLLQLCSRYNAETRKPQLTSYKSAECRCTCCQQYQLASSTKVFGDCCTPNCTGWMYRRVSTTTSASRCSGIFVVKVPSRPT